MNSINSNLFTNHQKFVHKENHKTQIQPMQNPMADASQVVQKLTTNIAKSKENIEQIQKLSDIILGRKTQFSVDQESGKIIVAIVDPQTNQVIKEIPSAEVQKMRTKLKRMAELSLTGSVLDLKA